MYSGTKEGMKQLLEDAEKISGVHYDMSSYADVIDALQVIQDQQHITGNAAEEASQTIGGSLNTLKASWSNMVTAFTDPNANPRVVFVQLAEAARNFIGNVGPFIHSVLDNLKTMLPVMITEVVSLVNELATTVLPSLLEAAFQLIQALGESIMSNIDVLIDVVVNVVAQLGAFLANNIGPLINAITTILTKLINKITQNMPQVVKTVLKIVTEVSKALIKAIPELVKAIGQMFVELAKAIWDNRGLIGEKFKDVFLSAKDAIIESFKGIWQTVKGLFTIGKDDVTVEGGTVAPAKNSGLYRVPYDGFIATLHKGERVLTSQEAAQYNKPQSPQVNNTFNITVPANENAMDTALRLKELTRREAMGYASI